MKSAKIRHQNIKFYASLGGEFSQQPFSSNVIHIRWEGILIQLFEMHGAGRVNVCYWTGISVVEFVFCLFLFSHLGIILIILLISMLLKIFCCFSDRYFQQLQGIDNDNGNNFLSSWLWEGTIVGIRRIRTGPLIIYVRPRPIGYCHIMWI